MSKEKEIDERLLLLSSMVRKGSALADVGCDHGILITHLLEEGIITGGVATDINEMPLEKAILRVHEMGMDDKISCRLGDGLNLVAEDEADDIVIAGMGGELIFKIISSCPWSRNKDKRFIVNPMTKAPYLRQAMAGEGFKLIDERASKANNKHYSVMVYEYRGEKEIFGEFDSFSYLGLLPNHLTEESKDYIKGQRAMILKKAEGLKEKEPELSKKYFDLAATLTEKGEL